MSPQPLQLGHHSRLAQEYGVVPDREKVIIVN